MYKCLGSCMHGNVCSCARSPALRLLFVYFTVRFVCGGLISICLSASTHTFASENGYTYTHACAHTVKLGKSAHLTIWYSYKTSRQQEEKKSVRQVAAVRLTAQNKVAKFRKTMFVFLSHTISARACARALSAFLPTSMDNSCCYCCSLTGWDLWKIAKFVKARKNSVQKNKQKYALTKLTNKSCVSQGNNLKFIYV